MFRLANDASPAPMAGPLRDPQGRTLDYLRLAVTDRCNLRCRYCMPAEGIKLVGRPDVLSLEEMQRLGALFTSLGVRKIRITGGEPLLRKGAVELIAGLRQLPSSPEVLLTTNGLLLDRNLDALQAAGVTRINLSLDSLDADNWFRITRRDGHDKVLRVMDRVLEMGLGLKVNMVVLPGRNEHEIPDFVALTKDRKMSVRFIEPMPFDGAGKPLQSISGEEIMALVKTAYDPQPLDNPVGAVDKLFSVPGHQGNIGVIEGHSRTFCASCRRLRIDARGGLRTCLYGKSQVDLRAMLRDGGTNEQIAAAVRQAVDRRLEDGIAAEKDSRMGGLESMASIGG
ncbi:MAG: GTP 3',8-cyclase MoaA [Candidatus Krumholzibacteria bacterium]|nr:GTP 3',8-cyclase MoaA [Candidatus Krumholzibacteria bacterium]